MKKIFLFLSMIYGSCNSMDVTTSPEIPPGSYTIFKHFVSSTARMGGAIICGLGATATGLHCYNAIRQLLTPPPNNAAVHQVLNNLKNKYAHQLTIPIIQPITIAHPSRGQLIVQLLLSGAITAACVYAFYKLAKGSITDFSKACSLLIKSQQGVDKLTRIKQTP